MNLIGKSIEVDDLPRVLPQIPGFDRAIRLSGRSYLIAYGEWQHQGNPDSRIGWIIYTKHGEWTKT